MKTMSPAKEKSRVNQVSRLLIAMILAKREASIRRFPFILKKFQNKSRRCPLKKFFRDTRAAFCKARNGYNLF
jgi:hypothetical protein